MRKYNSQVAGALRIDILKDTEAAVAFSGLQLESWISGAMETCLTTISSIIKTQITPLVPRLFSWLILAEEIGKTIIQLSEFNSFF